MFNFKSDGNAHIVPDCIAPYEGEKPIKQYDVAELYSPLRLARAYGKLQVTNKRVIFRAKGASIKGETTLQYEYDVADIEGIEIRKDWRMCWLYLIAALLLCAVITAVVGLIFGAITLAIPIGAGMIVWAVFSMIFSLTGAILGIVFFKRNQRYIPCIALESVSMGCAIGAGMTLFFVPIAGIIALLILLLEAVVCIALSALFAYMPNLVIKIKTKYAQNALEICRHSGRNIFWVFFEFWRAETDQFTGYGYVMPSKDTDLAIKEIGSIIKQAQKASKNANTISVNPPTKSNKEKDIETQEEAKEDSPVVKKFTAWELAVQKLSSELNLSNTKAQKMANDIFSINAVFQPDVENWLDGRELDIEFNGVSTKIIMEKDGCTYPEAMLRLDTIVTDFTKGDEYLRYTIRKNLITQKICIEKNIAKNQAEQIAVGGMKIYSKYAQYIDRWLEGTTLEMRWQNLSVTMIMEKEKCTYLEALIKLDYYMKNPPKAE